MTTIVVGNWRLDEGEGQIVGDSTGNRNNGQLIPIDNPPTWTDGRKAGSTALHFDETNTVKIGSDPTLTVLEPSSITVEAWVRSNDPNPPDPPRFHGYIVAKGANGSASYSLFASSASKELFFHVLLGGNTNRVIQSPSAERSVVWDGEWHHIAGTYDGDMVRLYVDGQEIATGTQADPPTDIVYDLPTRELFLGAFEGLTKERFAGDIAEVRIWNGALSSSEVLMRARGQELT